MTGTFSRAISFSTPERPTSGFPVSSSKRSSIFLPFTPPLALISSAAISYERFSISPNFACEPVRGSSTPTLIPSAARAPPHRTTANSNADTANSPFEYVLMEPPCKVKWCVAPEAKDGHSVGHDYQNYHGSRIALHRTSRVFPAPH